ncbi:hypothetical protein BTA51_14525 [Hahella sp. CCB-MM4]|uniref:hypothetical protein n=1 Tax=Hahella sp. (strain CCB-MM4) TaxID=1926491 RepID=UPI000B9A28B0|nr:hypothetical protein [Hahella sp. CCB-MM4]OZG72735.1 hypothetical protein BTA51_14525 [Hahella sp. CCB-MM4]
MSDKLSDTEAKAFADVNQRLGMGANETTFCQDHIMSKGSGPVHMSSDPLASHIPPKIIPVASIADMNKLVGIPDTNDDSHVEYPEPARQEHLNLLKSANSTDEFHRSVTPEMHENIRKAATAYVLGNSSKVKDYEPLINARMFPGKVAAFVADDIVITADNPLIIKPGDPQVHNYGTITVKPGGYIQVSENATINCQQFIME